jgi:hypothetical protein
MVQSRLVELEDAGHLVSSTVLGLNGETVWANWSEEDCVELSSNILIDDDDEKLVAFPGTTLSTWSRSDARQ